MDCLGLMARVFQGVATGFILTLPYPWDSCNSWMFHFYSLVSDSIGLYFSFSCLLNLVLRYAPLASLTYFSFIDDAGYPLLSSYSFLFL